MPWWSKIIFKIILSRLPINYGQWVKMKVFRHGNIDNLWSPCKKFLLHFNNGYPEEKPQKFYCLELGPGDSVASGVIAKGLGASKTYLVDVGEYATHDIDYYRALCREMKKHNMPAPDLTGVNSFKDLLKVCNIEYLTDGISSLSTIPTSSIDFIWSHSVLEHVRKNTFSDVVSEFRRVIVDTGRMSHNADLKDHLGGALNNLRFPERFWESDFMANSGFYTNRIQHQDMLCQFKKGGFNIVKNEVARWDKLPTEISRMDSLFKNISVDELRICTTHIKLEPAITDAQ